MDKMSFNWGNFLKPTPTNLLFFTEGIKSFLGAIAISSYVMDNTKLAFWVLVAGAILDLFSKFFAKAAEGERQVLKVEYPTEMADKIEIKTENIQNESGTSK